MGKKKKVLFSQKKRIFWAVSFLLLFIATFLLITPSPYYKADEIQQTINVTAGEITAALQTEIGFTDANGNFLGKQKYAILDEEKQEITYIRACAKVIVSGKNFNITKAKEVNVWVRIEILIQWERQPPHQVMINVGTIAEEKNYTMDTLSFENGAYIATYDRSFKLEYYISRWYKEWIKTHTFIESRPFYIYVNIHAKASGQDEYGVEWTTKALCNDFRGKFYYHPPLGTIKIEGSSGTWSILGSGSTSLLAIMGLGIIGVFIFSIYSAKKQTKRSIRRRKR